MTLAQASEELRKKLQSETEGCQWNGEWLVAGRGFWVAKLKMPRGGMMLATFTPAVGLTLFDSTDRHDGQSWKKF